MSEQSQEELAPDAVDEQLVDDVEQSDDESELDASEESDQAEEEEEIEHDGLKYRVPKSLKPLLMMQSDYTQKTQTLAEQRRSFEAYQNQANEAIQANFTDAARVVAMDDRLSQFQNVDWTALSNQNPLQAQQLWFEFQSLKETRENLAKTVLNREQARLAQQRELTAQKLAEGNDVLAKEIPGWGDELKAKIVKFGLDSGITKEELGQVTDPRFVKLLHAAYIGSQVMNKRQPSKPDTQAKPVRTVGKGQAAQASDMTRMSVDSWMKARNKQINAKRAR